MKQLFNGIIILLSISLVGIILRGNQSPSFYWTLLVIEWMIIIIAKPAQRRVTFMRLYNKTYFGDVSKPYGVIKNDNVERVLQDIEYEAFESLIRDMYISEGYKVEHSDAQEGEVGTLIVTKDNEVSTISICLKKPKSRYVASDILGQLEGQGYCGQLKIVTNGMFDKNIMRSAKVLQIDLLSGNYVASWLREIIEAQRQRDKGKAKKHYIQKKV